MQIVTLIFTLYVLIMFDMTFEVDWALKTNIYLSAYLSVLDAFGIY